jgi:PAS domain S-box-containing protein
LEVQPPAREAIDLQFIYDTAPIGLAFLSPDCRYLHINQRLTEICGISVADHLGRTVREMVPNVAEQVEQLVRFIMETGEPVTGIEVSGQRADKIGADRCWLTSWHPLRGTDGRILGVNVAAEEITERKRTQAALASSEQRYRALARASTSLVWTATADGQLIDSPEWRAFTGQSLEEVRGMRWLGAVHPHDRDSTQNRWQESVIQRTPFEVEYRIRRKDGVYVWHEVHGNAVFEDDGSVREWVGVCVDIDARKRAADQQEILNRSIERALDLLVSVSAAASTARDTSELASASLERICSAHQWEFAQVWYPDNGRLLCSTVSAWNARQFAKLRRISGETAIRPGEDLPGQVWDSKAASWFEEIAPGSRRLEAAREAGLATALVFPVVLGDEVLAVFEFFSRDMRRADRTTIDAVGQLGRILGDIWVRKRSEAALRTSEERWRLVFETSTLGISLTDHNLKFIATNRALQTMLGYSGEELRGLSPLDILTEAERQAGNDHLDELREGKRSNYEVATQFRRKDGTPISVNTFVSTIPGNEATPPVYLATAIDITDQQRAEEELWRTATYLAEAEKLSHTGSWARSAKTGELFWSQEHWRIFELDPATTQLSYALFDDMIHPEDRALVQQTSLRAVEQNKAYDVRFRVVLRDGTIKHIHSVGKPAFHEGSGALEYIGVSTDETDRVRANAAVHEAQAELARIARLTTVGELAASIAHEINQPLTAVVNNGNAALRWLTRDIPNVAEAKAALKNVVDQGTRASDVIERIRGLLRHDKHAYVGLDLNGAILDVVALTMGAMQSRGIAIQTSLAARLPHALGDRVQLQQVVMNLIMNGADAMSAVTDRPHALTVSSQLDESGDILVSVKDTGTGIDEAIRRRVFDPLFTTKSTGMGMGLSICRSIVEAHGGRLWASPFAPHGTVFQFTVPKAAAATQDGA